MSQLLFANSPVDIFERKWVEPTESYLAKFAAKSSKTDTKPRKNHPMDNEKPTKPPLSPAETFQRQYEAARHWYFDKLCKIEKKLKIFSTPVSPR